MKPLKLLMLVVCLVSSASGCIVSHRTQRPPHCRHAVWVGGRHHGHWECERPHRHRRSVIIVH
jgi:hypothetical protein